MDPNLADYCLHSVCICVLFNDWSDHFNKYIFVKLPIFCSLPLDWCINILQTQKPNLQKLKENGVSFTNFFDIFLVR